MSIGSDQAVDTSRSAQRQTHRKVSETSGSDRIQKKPDKKLAELDSVDFRDLPNKSASA